MVINFKKIKLIVNKALKNGGVFVGMLELKDGTTGYCINTRDFRIFIEYRYADNDFKAILVSIMGDIPILGECGTFYYDKNADEILEQETLFQYEDISHGASRAFEADIIIDDLSAYIDCGAKEIKGFKKELIDGLCDIKKCKENDIPQYFIKSIGDISYLIIKSGNYEIVISEPQRGYFKDVAEHLRQSGFIKYAIEEMLENEEGEN